MKGLLEYLWTGKTAPVAEAAAPAPSAQEQGPASIPFPDTALPDVIELRNVTQTYDKGRVVVLKDLDFRVEAKASGGRFVVILGPSGCGKSTILRYVADLDAPTSGQVLINGEPRRSTESVGMVFQQYSSLPWLTALENVMLGLRMRGTPTAEARDKAMAMLELVGLADRKDNYAKIPNLSGGQLQRVAIARSLVCNPKILLMDEPFGALDTNTRFKLQVLVAKLFEQIGSTVLFVTHDIPEAVFLADDIYIMSRNPGRIVHHMSVEDLGLHRDRATKRSPRYIEYVNQLEDQMIRLDAVSSSQSRGT